MYVQRNIEGRSYDHICSGKSIIFTYSEFVFVALFIRDALRMRHIIICGLSGSTKIFHIILLTARFKRKVTKHKMSFYFLYNYNYCLKFFLFLRSIERDVIKQYIGLQVSYPLFVSNVKEASIFPDRFSKDKYEIS
jgi:hypothetical protein